MEILEERIAALKNEQLLIKRNLQENLELDKELIQIVKELHRTIEEITIKTKQEKSRIGGLMMQKVDEVIEKICERIIEDCATEDVTVLSEEVKALAELVSARAMNN